MAVKSCVICSNQFTTNTRKITCSEKCRITRKEHTDNVNHYGQVSKPKSICVTCGREFEKKVGQKKNCSRECSAKYDNKRSMDNRHKYSESRRISSKKYRDKNKDKSQQYRKMVYENFPEKEVNKYMKRKLGFAPDDELVELATMRRLINRAIKKAGE